MKRCPQCEFIYEDDQSLCDMDGILLVFDSQKLPKPLNKGKRLRSRTVPVVGALVLATVLSLVYFVGMHLRKTTQSTDSGASVTAAQPVSSETQAVTSTPDIKVNAASVVEPKPMVRNTAGDTEPKKAVKTKSTSSQRKATAHQTEENDSKIESFMKKTGRLIKKPFKF